MSPPIQKSTPPRAASGSPAAAPSRWRQLALLSGLISMDNSETSVLSTLFPALRAALGLPLSALGLLVAVGKLMWMLFGPVWVVVAQRFGRKNVLVVCCGLWGLWTCAAGLAQNFTQMLVLCTIAAAGFAGGGPLVNGILADLFGDSSRGRAAGVLYGGVALLTAVVGPLMGQLSRIPDGWRYGFFISGGITVIFGVLVWRFFDDPAVGAADHPASAGIRPAGTVRLSRRDIRELLAGRTLRLILLQRLTSTQFAFVTFGVVYLVSVRGFSNAVASLVIPFAYLSYVAGTVSGGIISDRAQRRFPRTGRLAAWQAATLGWGVLAVLGTQIAWPSIWAYAGVFAILGFLQGFPPGANRPIVMAVTRPEQRGAAFALLLSVESAGWALGTLIISNLGDLIGLQATFLWLVAGLNIANGLFMTLIYRHYLRESNQIKEIR